MDVDNGRRNGRQPLLTIRASALDNLLLRRLYGLEAGHSAAPHRPDRLVVDAHVPLTPRGAALADTARIAGVPFLIDPETHYLQDRQCAEASWCAAPFANTEIASPVDLMRSAAQDALVESVIDYQVERGATAVIAPYVHVERPTMGWVQVQAGLWRRTRAYLQKTRINLPVIAVVALGWRCMTVSGNRALNDYWGGLTALSPDEVAVAASKAHMGADPASRIADLLSLVRRLSAAFTVTTWQQGLLGEACVIDGAVGYECGIGWREKCDLQTRMSQYRSPRTGSVGGRPVYIAQVGASVPKQRLEAARSQRALWAKLVCHTPGCCAPAGDDLVGDARRHDVIARAHELEQLLSTPVAVWQWHLLAQRLDRGLDIATRLNALGPKSSALPAVSTATLQALYEIADARRRRAFAPRRAASSA